jgi:hypothetical protein
LHSWCSFEYPTGFGGFFLLFKVCIPDDSFDYPTALAYFFYCLKFSFLMILLTILLVLAIFLLFKICIPDDASECEDNDKNWWSFFSATVHQIWVTFPLSKILLNKLLLFPEAFMLIWTLNHCFFKERKSQDYRLYQ